jgi:hypothetical protein
VPGKSNALHQPAATVSAAVSATAQKSVRRGGGANARAGDRLSVLTCIFSMERRGFEPRPTAAEMTSEPQVREFECSYAGAAYWLSGAQCCAT